jgi:hypothetical protein
VRRHFHRRPDGSARSSFLRCRLDLPASEHLCWRREVAGFFLAEAKPRCPSLQTNPLYGDITSSAGAVFLRMRYLRL